MMKSSSPANRPWIQDKAFLWLIIAASLAFAWIVAPLYGAVLWAVVITVLFAPLNRKLCRAMNGRYNLAAFATLGIITIIVIIPLTVLIISLVAEISTVAGKIETGDINFGNYIEQIFDSMPAWASQMLERFGVSNLGTLLDKASTEISDATKAVALQAVRIGQNTFGFFLNLFVMLYLLFFFLRDGDEIYTRIRDAVPLRSEHQRALFNKFIVVIRATVKGNMVVAILQGGLGGLIFWILGIQAPLLWAALMTILSLLPAIGAAVIWFPVAIYLLATGSVAKGVTLIIYGVVVISLVDNLVRPVLVGKDTKVPDYVVLISTLGGIAVFGLNGFVLGPVIAAIFISVWDIFAASNRVIAPT